MVLKYEDIKTSLNIEVKHTDLERIRDRCKGVSPMGTYVRRLVLADLDKDDCSSMIDVMRLGKENKALKDDLVKLRATLGNRTCALKRAKKTIERLYDETESITNTRPRG